MSRENVGNCLLMIQPSITAYESDQEFPQAVECDVECLKEDRILIVDTYFYIVRWYGESMNSWIQQGIHEDPEYEHIKKAI